MSRTALNVGVILVQICATLYQTILMISNGVVKTQRDNYLFGIISNKNSTHISVGAVFG